jgi:hypothetical protein
MTVMRVDFTNERSEVIGQAFLNDDGSIRFEGFATKIGDTLVVGPRGEKTPEDGAEYLYALPFTFRNAYCHAVLVQ